MNERRFADTRRFVHETIDGETVVLDTAGGSLFLFTGFGSWLWDRMNRGGTINEVIAEVSAHFGDDTSEPTREFLRLLVEERMLPKGASPGERPLGELPFPTTFVPPIIEKHDDIAQIITMDPIHDVDPDKGWPRPKIDKPDDES
jgi:hypothetical protein